MVGLNPHVTLQFELSGNTTVPQGELIDVALPPLVLTGRPARFIFVDLETTGLDCERDVITEMAWAYDEMYLVKSSMEASVESRRKTVTQHYYTKYEGFPSLWSARNTQAWPPGPGRRSLNEVLGLFFDTCLTLSENGTVDVYMVGACPAFDDRFLRKVFREVPYHYHVIDVEAYAIGHLGLAVPPKLKHLRELLGIPGENEHAHDALADALEAKLIWDTIAERITAR